MITRFLHILFLSLTFTGLGYAQATANFTATATIIQPITISTTSQMNFANIDAKNGGEVILTPESTRYTSGEVELDDASNVAAASFTVSGQKGYTYGITLPKIDHVLTNGKEEMIIKNFTTDLNSGSLADGSQTFRVGATLKVNPNQQPGIYVTPGSLNVTVNYN